MRIKTICFMALWLLAASSFAQFRAGVKGGANFSNIHINMNGVELETYEPRMGLHGGLMAEYMFSPRFGLQSELVYCYSGATINPDKYKQWFDVAEEFTAEGYIGMHTFQLPLYLKTKFALTRDCKIYVMGGGFATFSPAAYQQIRLAYGGESMKVKWSLYEAQVRILDQVESNAHLQQRWNTGLAAEAGVEIMNGLTVGGGFRQVLTNMAAFGYFSGGGSIKPTTKMWTATVSAGYFF